MSARIRSTGRERTSEAPPQARDGSRRFSRAIVPSLGLVALDFNELAEEQIEERHVELERDLVGIDQMLHGESHVKRDHRARDVLRRERRLPADLVEGGLASLCQESPVPAPERRRELPEFLVARRL